MWKKFKQATTRTVERVKNVGKDDIEKENPAYDAACEKYKDMKNHILVFLDNIDKFLKPLNNAQKECSEVAKCVEKDTATLEPAHTLSTEFSTLMGSLSTSMKDKIETKVRSEIEAPLKELQAKFKEYSKIRKEHKDLHLLLISNKQKLEKLQKANKEKEKEKTAEYQRKVDTKTEQLNSMEVQFINEINLQWANRYYNIHRLYINFSKILFQYLTFVCEQSQSLQGTLGSDAMSKDYSQINNQ